MLVPRFGAMNPTLTDRAPLHVRKHPLIRLAFRLGNLGGVRVWPVPHCGGLPTGQAEASLGILRPSASRPYRGKDRASPPCDIVSLDSRVKMWL